MKASAGTTEKKSVAYKYSCCVFSMGQRVVLDTDGNWAIHEWCGLESLDLSSMVRGLIACTRCPSFPPSLNAGCGSVMTASPRRRGLTGVRPKSCAAPAPPWLRLCSYTVASRPSVSSGPLVSALSPCAFRNRRNASPLVTPPRTTSPSTPAHRCSRYNPSSKYRNSILTTS